MKYIILFAFLYHFPTNALGFWVCVVLLAIIFIGWLFGKDRFK
jgi:hypothetical protein